MCLLVSLTDLQSEIHKCFFHTQPDVALLCSRGVLWHRNTNRNNLSPPFTTLLMRSVTVTQMVKAADMWYDTAPPQCWSDLLWIMVKILRRKNVPFVFVSKILPGVFFSIATIRRFDCVDGRWGEVGSNMDAKPNSIQIFFPIFLPFFCLAIENTHNVSPQRTIYLFIYPFLPHHVA